ncbi:MAG: rhomboid family intramembrane serine protease [Planctomycetota bacterium]|jgi:membrane associated rhomboid family serine protease
MIIIPYKVDVPYDRRPFLNWSIVVAILGAFGLQYLAIATHFRQSRDYGTDEGWQYQEQQNNGPADANQLSDDLQDANQIDQEPTDPHQRWLEQQTEEMTADEALERLGPVGEYFLNGWTIKGLFGHMWLHGGLLHLIGNVWFLWVFGNAVCAKVGNPKYLPLYLLFGLGAGVSHLLFASGPAIGASGAINGVVGMFLVFFPRNDLDCLFLLFIPGMVRAFARTFTISSYWMILMWFAFDIWGGVKGGGQVAYFAHIGGFASGVALGIILLKTKLIVMEDYEQSLLQWIGLEKQEQPAASDMGSMDFWQQQSQMVDTAQAEPKPIPFDPPMPVAEPKPIPFDPPMPVAEPEPIPFGPAQPDQQFIRLVCACGKRIKAPASDAGKTGRCPKCNAELKIPDIAKAQPKKTSAPTPKPADDLIRFTCSCGKRVKVPVTFAGKTGRCPKCSTPLKIPEKPLE